uniref:Uncharacterized protein n=1 Tax=Helicotheca tamesis TaxID=374047 RepID=A0A7S2IC20_9STRA|mmetsp:Transcript_7775/g.10619  ORF Transcript_7775/g.10619 Transcript_7775/m.10619 type:complete len:249 (+) Transcript_7775:120-866(+)
MSLDESAAAEVNKLTLLDLDEAAVRSREVLGVVSEERLSVWSGRLEAEGVPLEEGCVVAAVRCEGSDGSMVEHAVRVPKAGGASALLLECKVSYEEVPPSCLVEYSFSPSGPSWRLSNVSLPWLVAYRKGKFKDWEARMLAPSCKAEFRRMYEVGPVFTIYDHHMFPSDPSDAHKFQVTDDATGKTVVIPRPVKRLRIWNTQAQSYDTVRATLDGAPDDQDAYWLDLKNRIRDAFGEDEFQDMIAKPE